MDLSKHPSFRRKRATSTVAGAIIDTGALGAAVGQYMVGMPSNSLGWKSVFIFFVRMLMVSQHPPVLSLFRLSAKESHVFVRRESQAAPPASPHEMSSSLSSIASSLQPCCRSLGDLLHSCYLLRAHRRACNKGPNHSPKLPKCLPGPGPCSHRP